MALEQLDTLMAQTEQLLLSALQNEWEDFAALYAEQDQLLHAQLPVITGCAEHERQQLQHLSQMLQQIIDLAEQHKAEIASELRQFNQGRVGQKAYSQNTE